MGRRSLSEPTKLAGVHLVPATRPAPCLPSWVHTVVNASLPVRHLLAASSKPFHGKGAGAAAGTGSLLACAGCTHGHGACPLQVGSQAPAGGRESFYFLVGSHRLTQQSTQSKPKRGLISEPSGKLRVWGNRFWVLSPKPSGKLRVVKWIFLV